MEEVDKVVKTLDVGLFSQTPTHASKLTSVTEKKVIVEPG